MDFPTIITLGETKIYIPALPKYSTKQWERGTAYTKQEWLEYHIAEALDMLPESVPF